MQVILDQASQGAVAVIYSFLAVYPLAHAMTP